MRSAMACSGPRDSGGMWLTRRKLSHCKVASPAAPTIPSISNVLRSWKFSPSCHAVSPRARKALKPGVILAVLLLGLLETFIVYSAFDPYFTWYFRDFHSRIIVDGKPSQRRVHRDHSGRSLFATRTDLHEPMTYMIIIA